jgi:hemolysin activation/secretion protein
MTDDHPAQAPFRASLLLSQALAAGCLMALAAPSTAQAQIAPPGPGAILRQTVQPPAPLLAPGEVLSLPEPNQQESKSTVPIPVGHLTIAGATLIPAETLHELVQPAEGQTLTLQALRDYVNRITEAYHKQGYPVAYAYLPAQKIHEGQIRIEVVEPHYDQITTSGPSRLRPEVATRTLGVHPGDVVASAPLERGLLLLNQTPGVQINGTLIPGSRPATTSLRIESQDQPPVTGTLSENNYGNRYTGTYLTNTTVTANDPFGFGSALAVNGMISNTGGLKSDGVTLTSPDIWDGLRAGAYASQSFYRLGGTFSDLDQVGRATQLGGDVSYPLILQPGRLLNLRLDVLRDWLAQSTKSVGTDARQSILIERLTLEGAFADSWHGTTTGSAVLSHGDLARDGGTAASAAAHTAGSYEVLQLGLGRTQELPSGFQLNVNLASQVSDKNLDSSQQFFLGGPYGVMSYQTGDAGGDEGYLLRIELSHTLPIPGLPGTLTGSLQMQNGTLWVHHSPYQGVTGPEQMTLNGIGAGLAYRWNHLTIDASYIRRVGANGAPGYSTHADVLWFQVGLSL